jgi:hypothetical protein
LTVVDVDAAGGLNVLFPTPHAEAGFLPEGFAAAGATVRIPDSFASDNAAGFHWPFAAPAGTDTIQVFAATDRATAALIREHIGRAGAPPARGADVPQARCGRRGLDALRTILAGQLLRRGGPGEGPLPPAPDWASAAVQLRIVE